MMVQEQGVAVGWPLNLGHDTTGWPLGLRLRLLHEDLQWPKMPELALSSSSMSADSSSLDTLSTKSFFQDNSKSLGSLIGLPIVDANGNPVRFHLQDDDQDQQQHQQPQRQRYRLASRSPSTVRPNSPASSPVLQNAHNGVKNGSGAKSRRHRHHHHHHGRNSRQQQQHLHQQQNLSTASPPHNTTSIASHAGWSLLSALSCARVPAEIGASANEDEETSIPRAQLVPRELPREIPLRISAQNPTQISTQNPEMAPQETDQRTAAVLPPLLSSRRVASHSAPQLGLNSLAKKLYDNITFEDEELELHNLKQRRKSTPGGLSSDGSSEWNPLFASSPQASRDEETNEHDENDDGDLVDESSSRRVAGTMTTMCDHLLVQRASCTTAVPLMTILGRPDRDSDQTLQFYCRKGSRLRMGGCPTSMTFCVDVGKWQLKQKQLSHGRPQGVNMQMEDHSLEFMSHGAQMPESLPSRAVSAFVNRMVCCLSTPTRGSTF
ncbi:unnamed protein product [Calypogeia fissa]